MRRPGGGGLNLAEVARRYIDLVVAQAPNLREAARRLGIHPNTVSAKVDQELLERFKRLARAQ